MRFCLVSDTHRYRHELLMAVKNTQPATAVLHAGDEASDARWLMERGNWPVYGVAGNWDTPSDLFPTERILNFGLQIFLVHGHRQRVKEGISLLVERAKDVHADIVIYGHSHVASVMMSDGILLVNPGSLAAPRGRRERTFAMMEIDEIADKYLIRISHCLSSGQTVAGLTSTIEFVKTGL